MCVAGAHPGTDAVSGEMWHPASLLMSALPPVLKPNEAFLVQSDLQLCSCLAESLLKLQELEQFEEMRHKRT